MPSPAENQISIDTSKQPPGLSASQPLCAFDRSLRVAEVRPGHHVGHIDSAWNVVRGPNGGFLAALLLRTVTRDLTDRDRRPRVLTVQYVAVPKPGPIHIRTQLLRRGRSLSWLAAELVQDGQVCVTAKVAMSTDWPSVEYTNLVSPGLSPEQTVEIPPKLMPPFAAHYEYRTVYATPYEPGQGDAVGGHIRLRDARPYDPSLIAAICDAWYPATFAFEPTPVMGATLDLTVHFRNHKALERLAPEDYILSVFRSRRATEGFFEEDGELWSPDGELIAQSRQLAVATPLTA